MRKGKEEKLVLFKPLEPGRAKEIYQAMGEALEDFRRNPRSTVEDFGRAVQPEMMELNQASKPAENLKELGKMIRAIRIQRGWGVFEEEIVERLAHEEEHLSRVREINPCLNTRFEYVYDSSPESADHPAVNVPNLIDVYRNDKRGLISFYEHTVNNHSHPSDFDLLLVGRKR